MNETGNTGYISAETVPLDAMVGTVAKAIQTDDGSPCISSLKLKLCKDPDGCICRSLARAAIAAMPGWQPIETAPKDGRLALVYRPLARNSGDEPIAVKRLIKGNHHCWESTVPAGAQPMNPTDGACHVTHWMPFPAPPEEQS